MPRTSYSVRFSIFTGGYAACAVSWTPGDSNNPVLQRYLDDLPLVDGITFTHSPRLRCAQWRRPLDVCCLHAEMDGIMTSEGSIETPFEAAQPPSAMRRRNQRRKMCLTTCSPHSSWCPRDQCAQNKTRRRPRRRPRSRRSLPIQATSVSSVDAPCADQLRASLPSGTDRNYSKQIRNFRAGMRQAHTGHKGLAWPADLTQD